MPALQGAVEATAPVSRLHLHQSFEWLAAGAGENEAGTRARGGRLEP
jgi:hypothetical protein